MLSVYRINSANWNHSRLIVTNNKKKSSTKKVELFFLEIYMCYTYYTHPFRKGKNSEKMYVTYSDASFCYIRD